MGTRSSGGRDQNPKEGMNSLEIQMGKKITREAQREKFSTWEMGMDKLGEGNCAVNSPRQMEIQRIPRSWEKPNPGRCSPKSRTDPKLMGMLPKNPLRCPPKIRTGPNPMDILPKKQDQPQSHGNTSQKTHGHAPKNQDRPQSHGDNWDGNPTWNQLEWFGNGLGMVWEQRLGWESHMDAAGMVWKWELGLEQESHMEAAGMEWELRELWIFMDSIPPQGAGDLQEKSPRKSQSQLSPSRQGPPGFSQPFSRAPFPGIPRGHQPGQSPLLTPGAIPEADPSGRRLGEPRERWHPGKSGKTPSVPRWDPGKSGKTPSAPREKGI